MANPQDELDLRALRAQLGALTARVHELEKKAGIEPIIQPAPGVPAPTAPAPTTPPPPPPPPLIPRQAVPAPDFLMQKLAPSGDSSELESKIGKVWLNRIGIFAILGGVAYFIKYAFDYGWIGPAGRVAIGLFAGIGIVLWSERFRKKNYAAFSYSLKAVGIGILYLSLWGAFQVFHLIPASMAFTAMILVTASTMVLAINQDAQILAAYALIGGFSSPVLVSTNQNHEVVLFSYVALLDIAMLVAAMFKPWRRLMVGSFVGTMILFVGWYSHPSFYTREQRPLTVFFAGLFFAIFAAIPLLTPLKRSSWHRGQSVTLMLLPLINAAAFFLILYDMYENEKATLTWYALVLAGYYLGLSSLLQRRTDAEADTRKLVNLLHIGIAIGFITIAIPLKLDAHWITIGWLVESAVLLLIAVRTQTDFLRYFAGAVLALGVFRLLFWDSDHIQNALIFNSRFATYVVAIAILAGIVAAGERFASEREMPFVKIAGLCLNLLALIALTLEAHDYFSRQQTAEYATSYAATGHYERLHQVELAWDFSYSAIWLIYGAGMMAFGFWKRDAFVRWQALVLMALTIGKVFTYDTWNLQQVYRILSFIGLGVVLMGISYIYHRDWLKLSPRASGTAKGTSA